MENNDNRNVMRRDYASIATFESYLSNENHDTSINVYGGEEIDARESMWRFNSKFNVFISKDSWMY